MIFTVTGLHCCLSVLDVSAARVSTFVAGFSLVIGIHISTNCASPPTVCVFAYCAYHCC